MERENDEWYGFLFHRYMFLKEELDFFEHAVNGLDERHRSIITDLLDEDMTWDIMMERYHVSHTMIGKYRKAALKELDKQYELGTDRWKPLSSDRRFLCVSVEIFIMWILEKKMEASRAVSVRHWW